MWTSSTKSIPFVFWEPVLCIPPGIQCQFINGHSHIVFSQKVLCRILHPVFLAEDNEARPW